MVKTVTHASLDIATFSLRDFTPFHYLLDLFDNCLSVDLRFDVFYYCTSSTFSTSAVFNNLE